MREDFSNKRNKKDKKKKKGYTYSSGRSKPSVCLNTSEKQN